MASGFEWERTPRNIAKRGSVSGIVLGPGSAQLGICFIFSVIVGGLDKILDSSWVHQVDSTLKSIHAVGIVLGSG